MSLSEKSLTPGDRVMWARREKGRGHVEYPAKVLRVCKTHASIRFERAIPTPRGTLLRGTSASMKALRRVA